MIGATEPARIKDCVSKLGPYPREQNCFGTTIRLAVVVSGCNRLPSPPASTKAHVPSTHTVRLGGGVIMLTLFFRPQLGPIVALMVQRHPSSGTRPRVGIRRRTRWWSRGCSGVPGK